MTGKKRGKERKSGKGRERESVGGGRVKWEKGGDRKWQGRKGCIVYNTALPNPHVKFKWAALARRGGQRKEGRREGKYRKGKDRDRKGRSGLSPSKKIIAGSHASIINLLLNWLIDGKLLIETGSSLQISLRLCLILLLRWRRTVFLITLSSEESRSTPT